ncbi:hypothetical protein PSI19_00160 [Xenorhabdus khoisanae]|uniref:hypothetical protein n=1 Tax=Xenorhabdus TaxID=626 RepID=UPI002358A3D0|nr:hypothetical protein [Xenorhabdus khoisanae]MDC9612324.1 hypothetical protein [Xenorhabdus khoisanae]
MSDEQALSTGNKAIGVAGGSGAGVFLLQFAEMISADYRNMYIASVPFVAIILSELFTFVTALITLDPQKLRFKIWLFFNKRRLRRAINGGSLNSEMLAKAQTRYSICVGIDAGLYNPEDYWKLVDEASSTPPAISPEDQRIDNPGDSQETHD